MAFIQQGTLVNKVVLEKGLSKDQRKSIIKILLEGEYSRRERLILLADEKSREALAELFTLIQEGDGNE